MDFRKLASKAGRALGDEVYKKANEMEKATRKDLSRRTDSEIRRAYDKRYDNLILKVGKGDCLKKRQNVEILIDICDKEEKVCFVENVELN